MMFRSVFILINVFVAGFLTACSSPSEDIFTLIENEKQIMSLTGVCTNELFQTPEKEYLNLTDECEARKSTCLKKCGSGSANHCFGLAYNLEGEEIDPIFANLLFAKSCQLGLMLGCTNHAAGLRYHHLATNSCYTASFEFTCSKDDPWGCAMYGLAYWQGDGVEVDFQKAASAFDKTCAILEGEGPCESAQEWKAEMLSKKPK